jgi:N-acetylmuramoyl-L-alanine amidase
MFRKIVFSLFLLFSALFTLEAAGRQFVVVIDAGHGGNDCGAKGMISFEKNLTLRYALAVGKAIEENCPDVRVIYTRKTDVFIPLHERADIANRNKADLFISVHINALAGGRISHGFQSYTLGTGEHTGSRGIQENLEVAKRENSVIFMEKDYKMRYKGLENSAEGDIMFELIADKNRERSVELSRLMQREVCKATGRENGGAHQNNLAVLRLTSMPAVLLELGFITTPDEENYLNTDSALDAYTSGIVNAFKIYKQRYGGAGIDIPYKDTGNDTADSASLSAESAEVAEERPVTPRQRTRRSNVRQTERKLETEQKTTNKAAEKANDKKNVSKKVADSKVVDKNAPVFKIQIFAGKQKIKAGSPLFKGLEGCDSFSDGKLLRYTYGASTNYNEIRKQRTAILDKFPECFIIAMKDGKVVDVNEAIREFLKNKRK